MTSATVPAAKVPSRPDTLASVAAAEMEQRLTDLEIKVSYADDLLDTLNELVARQQETIDLLVREVSRLRQHSGESSGPGQRDPRDELPPHY